MHENFHGHTVRGGRSYAQLAFWGVADYEVNEIIEVFAERENAEEMLRECLSDEPDWAGTLEVVPLELELSLN